MPAPAQSYDIIMLTLTSGLFMTKSVRTIIELNIKHYRALLRTTTEAAKRQTIAQLLAEEEAKLSKLSARDSGERNEEG